MKRCAKCGDHDETVSFRERSLPGLRVLCAACNVDVRTSSTRRVAVVPVRVVEDRYTLLARKHGLA